MKRTKDWRRYKNFCIQNKRYKFIKNFDQDEWWKIYTKQKHRLVDRHPLDCGCTQCYLCHSAKLLNLVNPHDTKRQMIEIEEDYSI